MKDKETLVFVKKPDPKGFMSRLGCLVAGCFFFFVVVGFVCLFVCILVLVFFPSCIYNGEEEVEERFLLEKEFVGLGSMR